MLLLSPALARASEEDFLPWKSVQLECFETRQTGKVRVTAKPDSFAIEAFGRSHVVSKADLAKLKGFPLESLRVTHEAGYAQTGGHTVHASLRRAGETVTVSVSKSKGLAVSTRSR